MQSSIRNWLGVCITIATVVFTQPVFADNGYILQIGKDIPLCQQMLKILNLPENAHSLGYRTTGKEFTIPEKYKDFELVKWTPVPKEEVIKYVTPETFKTLELVKERALNIEKDWDGKGDWEFEVAKVNIDGHGEAETMLRYRLPNWKKPSCMLADTENKKYIDRFNPYKTYNNQDNKDYGLEKAEQCQVFKYNGRAYHTTSLGFGAGFLMIKEPKPLPHWGDVDPYIKADLNAINSVCEIKNLNRKNEPTGEIK